LSREKLRQLNFFFSALETPRHIHRSWTSRGSSVKDLRSWLKRSLGRPSACISALSHTAKVRELEAKGQVCSGAVEGFNGKV